MSVCPEYNLSKVVLLILSIITLIIVSFCIDTYRDYYEDGSKTNKNKWLKYQLTLFFCNCIIVYSFYRIKTGKENTQQPYNFPDGFKFSSLFAIMNLISVISGGTRKKNGALIFYLFSSMSIILSCILGYKYIKEFINANPVDSESLKAGFTRDFKRGVAMAVTPYNYLRKKNQERKKKNNQQMTSRKRRVTPKVDSDDLEGIQMTSTKREAPKVRFDLNLKTISGPIQRKQGQQKTDTKTSQKTDTKTSQKTDTKTLTPVIRQNMRKQLQLKGDGLHGLKKGVKGPVQFEDIREEYKTGDLTKEDFNFKKFQGKITPHHPLK